MSAYPEAIQHYPKSTQLFIKKLYNRVEGGKNALIVCVGQTGSGKSLSVLQLMKGLHLYRYGREQTNESLIEHTIFKAIDFMEQMNKPDLKKKEVWLWDEAGIDVGHKDFMSMKNKIIGWLAQTFRNLQQIVFFTVPSIKMIDATVRKLLHYYLETVTIDTKKKVCIMKPLEMQYNPRLDKVYYHNLKSLDKEGYYKEVEVIGIRKIELELEKMYDVKKNQFTQDLNRQIQAKLTKMEVIEKKELIPLNKPLTERQEKILECLKRGIISQQEIAKEIGCFSSAVSSSLRFMASKGININKFLRKTDFQRLEPIIAPLST